MGKIKIFSEDDENKLEEQVNKFLYEKRNDYELRFSTDGKTKFSVLIIY